MLIPMIDTLVATLDIEDYEKSANELVEKLELKKEKAKSAATDLASEKILIKLGNMDFQVLPNGTRSYAYILHNDKYEVKLCQYRSKQESFFPVFVKIKSEWLWANGPEKSWLEFKEWVNENIGQVIENKISRLDLCCHTDEVELLLNDMDSFKGNFKRANIEFNNRDVNSFTFGARNSKIYCRIYNKTLEVNAKKKKMWFFDIWKNKNLDSDKVWNIEFELKREFLRDYSINTVEEAFNNLKSLWEYCTKTWLVKVTLDNSRIDRCSVDNTWKKIQEAFNKFDGKPLVKREVQLDRNATALVPGTIGNITSYAARRGIKDINIILTMLRNEGSNYLSNVRNTDYNEVINEKMATI